MNVQDLLGAMLQGAAGGQGRQRLEAALGGGGQGDVLGQILGGMLGGGGAARGGTGGGLGEILGAVLGGRGGAAGAGAGGGLGDLLGQILGGAGGGAGAGGLLSILASLAIGAMQGGGASAAPASAGPGGVAPAGMPGAPADPETVSLLSLKAMIAATKADGQVDDQEVQAVLARMGAAAQDPDARAFLEAEFRKPLDLGEIVGQVRDPQTAAQVYLASMLAIRVDTRNEAAYLQQLAQALRLPPEVVARVHQMVGLRPA